MTSPAASLRVIVFAAFSLATGLGVVDAVWPLSGLPAGAGAALWWVDFGLLTRPSSYNTEYVFQARHDDAWGDLPMAEWFPARWDGRLRWDRERVEASEEVRRAFLIEACERSGAREVRVLRRRWPRQPGREEQARIGLTEKALGARSCALPPPQDARRTL